MRIQNTVPIYNNKIQPQIQFASKPSLGRDVAEFSTQRNILQKTLAKGLLKIYKWLDAYGSGADKDLDKMLSRNDISFKKLLLYMHSGGMHFRELLGAKSLDEINLKDRKSLLKKIVKDEMIVFELNKFIFPGLSDILPVKYFSKETEKNLYNDFPLIPKNETEYTAFLEELVASLGKKSDVLPQDKINIFNNSLTDLTENLTQFSDKEFMNSNVMKLKGVNVILNCIPELNSTIGRKQHGAHDFDVFRHSLKVLKYVGEDEGFKNLNNSDKRIMMMAALMHDITKKEGVVDESHPLDGSLETYFIAKRFNLTKDEETKLYKLIKNHEWLKYVNITSKNKRDYRIMNVSWEFMKDNLFDMALIFTHADLKAVKSDGSFHDSVNSKAHIKLNGKVRSFGEAADIYAKDIKNRITYLQRTQPIVPMTKFPNASRIREAVTEVYSDGSTNIKGIYIDKDGLVVLKFNEVEDWEKIGFPKGSTTKGIKVKLDDNEEVETGNIKFLAHGLAYENQLARFCAFSLPDSNALLSVSYAERPETKFRFFRPQGLLGYTDTFNIVGGGAVDAGSGFKKSFKNFRYLLEYTARRQWRPYVSNLIKKATGMNSKEYQEFVLANQNKSYCEIYPVEIREKMIKTLGAVKSNRRRGAREYNEYYATQFTPMAPFAYNMDDRKIENPIEFLNRDFVDKQEKKSCADWGLVRSVKERTAFLRTYALKHDMPFVVLG